MVTLLNDSENLIVESEVLLLDDFLKPEEHSQILSWIEKNQENFDESTFLVHGESVVDKDFRQSLMLKTNLDPVYDILIKSLAEYNSSLNEHFNCTVDSSQKYFCQLFASNDGAFFSPHRDNLYEADEFEKKKKATIVYYLNRSPKKFEGGELYVWDRYQDKNGKFLFEVPEQGALIEPLNNRAVVFNGDCLHEALPVSCPSKEFMDSRFCIVIMLH